MLSDCEQVDARRRETGLTFAALHLRYVALGGSATQRSITSHVLGVTRLDDGEHDLLVHAVNERCLELGLAGRLPYQLRSGSD